MKIAARLAGILVCSASFSAFGQAMGGCPNGLPAGTPGCVPPTDPRSPLSNSLRVPPPRWADQWAAISMDWEGDAIGASTHMTRKAGAERAAIDQCKERGGIKCKIALTYLNQCGVVVWGLQHWSTAHGETIEVAEEIATKACSKHTQDCRIYYSNCSYPVRVN